MGHRSMNYIVLKPNTPLTPNVAKYLGEYREISDARGELFVFESNFTPLWARDGRGENCTLDLEEEVAIQRFLGSLAVDSFYLKRAGDQCDYRGKWVAHPFLNEPLVKEIEAEYLALLAEA
jgi:hypothetical protein